MPDAPHPDEALFPGERRPPVIPACDHYAGTEALMEKALRLQAGSPHTFDVTLDLEDGAPSGREPQHAALVVDLLRSELNTKARAGVRVHDVTSPHWRRDIDTLVRGAGDRIAHVTLPKVPDARATTEMITCLQRACALAGLQGEIPVHVLIETHGALAEAREIAGLPWLRGLDFGIMDFVSAHHGAIPAAAMRSPLQFDHALVRRAKAIQCAAALGRGLVPVHGVTLALRDPEAVHADARRARDEFGYQRMWSIHPSQIEPICRAFAPEDHELELAGRVLLAGWAASWAPVGVDDQLYDRASYRYFWLVLRRAKLESQALPDGVESAFFRA